MRYEEKYKKLDEFIESVLEEEEKLRELYVVKEASKIFGGVSKDVRSHISKRLDISEARIRGIMKYNGISEFIKGKNHISICMGTTCMGKGARDILSLLEDELDIKRGEVTEDGLFSLDSTGCIRYCMMAPIVTVNGRVYSQVKPDEVRGIIKSYRK